jgi:hypothetical protein
VEAKSGSASKVLAPQSQNSAQRSDFRLNEAIFGSTKRFSVQTKRFSVQRSENLFNSSEECVAEEKIAPM